MKRGQMKLSFGMIFSIILIIIFLVFAFWGIKKFLSIQDSAKIAQFKNSLQSDIDDLWKANQGFKELEYFLPSKVEYVCLVDYSISTRGTKISRELYVSLKDAFPNDENNLIFHPIGSAYGLDALSIKHIDLNEIIKSENPFCIKNVKGKVKMTLKKDYGEALVTITR